MHTNWQFVATDGQESVGMRRGRWQLRSICEAASGLHTRELRRAGGSYPPALPLFPLSELVNRVQGEGCLELVLQVVVRPASGREAAVDEVEAGLGAEAQVLERLVGRTQGHFIEVGVEARA